MFVVIRVVLPFTNHSEVHQARDNRYSMNRELTYLCRLCMSMLRPIKTFNYSVNLVCRSTQRSAHASNREYVGSSKNNDAERGC